MDNSSNEEKCKSTPERKKEYVQRWLQVNSFTNAQFDLDTREKTPPNSPKQNQKHTLCTQVSPILGGKRIASSPIIGGSRSLKRVKLFRRSIIKNENNEATLPNVVEETEKFEKVTKFEKDDHDCNKATNVSKIDNPILSEPYNTITNDMQNLNDPVLQQSNSQFIESVSSKDASNENCEVNVQEVHSNSGKTESDLIEDIATQIITEQACSASHLPCSQNISNPSSSSSTSCIIGNVDEQGKLNTTEANTSLQFLGASLDQIVDSPSTLECKLDFGKTSCILHYTDEKQKRKSKPKKGSLLDALTTSMAKARSHVNLFRHQLNSKSSLMASKPFVLAQVFEYLPRINNNQFAKCKVLEDASKLLSDLSKGNTITIMNVPEISGLVNTSEKPILKIYEPWEMLDSKQLLLHVTKFVAIPSDSTQLALHYDCVENKNLKVVYEHHCPCLDEQVVSVKCKTSFTNSSNDIVKIMLDNNYYE